MTRSELFKAAHKNTSRFEGHYSVRFKAALDELYGVIDKVETKAKNTVKVTIEYVKEQIQRLRNEQHYGKTLRAFEAIEKKCKGKNIDEVYAHWYE